jgi:hypothetical protein
LQATNCILAAIYARRKTTAAKIVVESVLILMNRKTSNILSREKVGESRRNVQKRGPPHFFFHASVSANIAVQE